jgi:NB-ARC domain
MLAEEGLSETSYQSSIVERFVGVRDSITELHHLMPELEQLTFNGDVIKSTELRVNWDLHHVRQKFPNANKTLIERLGVTMWNRRQHLMTTTRGSKSISPGSKSAVVTAKSEISAEDPLRLNVGRPSSKKNDFDASGRASTTTASQSKAQTKSSTEHQSSAQPPSQVETKPTAFTDAASESELAKPRLTGLPLPPTTDHSCNGEEFDCPYCFKRLANVVNQRIWRYHVMTDLEPYICTSGGCQTPNRTYWSKQDWIDHELYHRLPRQWECPLCTHASFAAKVEGSPLFSKGEVSKTLYNERDQFRDHLQNEHAKNYPIETIEDVIEHCERQEGQELSNLQCPLCQRTCENNLQLFTHIADELEQLALFALPPNPQAPLVKDGFEQLTEDDLKNVRSLFSPGIIKGLSTRKDRAQILESILRHEKEELELSDQRNRDLESEDQDEATLVREIPLAWKPRKRVAACEFPVSTIDQERDPDFFERNIWNFERIHESLADPERNVCVIHGPGGVGKTLFAKEFSHRFKLTYDAMFWLSTETENGLLESMRQASQVLQLGLDGTEDDTETFEITREWMRTTGRFLVWLRS